MIAFSFFVSVSCLEADQKEVSFALAPGVVIISSSDLFFDNSLETEVSFTTTLRYVVVFLPTKLADSFPKGARSATNLSFDKNHVLSSINLYSWMRLSFSKKFTLASFPKRKFIF